nr:tegument protein UL37 [Equid alphaherpesvirus 1]
MAREHGSMRALVNSLAGLLGETDTEVPSLEPAMLMVLKSSISEFFLSTDTVSVDEAAELFPRLQFLACRAYAASHTPDAAMLSENLAGLVLWRIHQNWTDREMEAVDQMFVLLEIMNGESGVYMLSNNNLRISAKYGPSNMHLIVSTWLDTFRNVMSVAAKSTPDSLFNSKRMESIEEFSKPLVHAKFNLIYDMPFVQEGLRIVAKKINWILPFGLMVKGYKDMSMAPLTRALFLLSLVDSYFPKGTATEGSMKALTAYFRELVRTIDNSAFVPITEVNATPRTAYEVRVSSAIVHQNPYVTDTKAGMVAERVRTDAEILTSGALLSSGALSAHATAVAKLLSSNEPDDVSSRARARVAEHASNTWETIQASTTPTQVVEALVTAGFTSTHCGILERVVVDYFTRLRSTANSGPGRNDSLDYAQQVVGCVAIVGGVVFRLLLSYGFGLDYIRDYTTTISTLEPVYNELLSALGLADKGVEQTLKRSMAPRPYMNYISAARAALDDELLIVEKRTTGPGTHSAARESLLTWFDFRARDRWGVRIPDRDTTSTQVLAPITASLYSDDDLIAAASKLSFDALDAPPTQIIDDPSFAPYILATVVLDAFNAILTSRFSADSVSQALRVLSWARDYGAGSIANVDGYRTKLTAIIASVSPFLQKDAPTPTMAHANNLEALLGELHSVVVAAIALIPERARMPVPERPSVKTSTFLAGLFLTAVYKRLETLVGHTAELTNNILGTASGIVSSIVTLNRFFNCRIMPVMGHYAVLIYPQSAQSAPFGRWRLVDVVDAVGSIYNEVSDLRADLRADVVTLKGDITSAAEALQECEALAVKTEGTRFGKLFNSLLTRHTQLARAQRGLAIRAGKLLGGSEAPGLKHVNTFLQRWGAISVMYQKATSGSTPEVNITSLANTLRHVWDEVQQERKATPPSRKFSNRDLGLAVERLMGGYPEVLDDDSNSTALTPKFNVDSWNSVNMDALRKRVTMPANIDSIRGNDSLATREYLKKEDLLAEIDAIFNNTK